MNHVDLYSTVFPGQSAPSLVLQMSRAAGWEYSLSTDGVNSACQAPRASGFKPLFPSPLVLWWTPTDSPAIPVVWDQRRNSHKVPLMLGNIGHSSWFLLSHWRNQRLRGDLCAWYCTGLEEGQCGRHTGTSHVDFPGLCGAAQCFILTPSARILPLFFYSWTAVEDSGADFEKSLWKMRIYELWKEWCKEDWRDYLELECIESLIFMTGNFFSL